ncbi:unnamed protein product [Lampetra fluviatilis]
MRRSPIKATDARARDRGATIGVRATSRSGSRIGSFGAADETGKSNWGPAFAAAATERRAPGLVARTPRRKSRAQKPSTGNVWGKMEVHGGGGRWRVMADGGACVRLGLRACA